MWVLCTNSWWICSWFISLIQPVLHGSFLPHLSWFQVSPDRRRSVFLPCLLNWIWILCNCLHRRWPCHFTIAYLRTSTTPVKYQRCRLDTHTHTHTHRLVFLPVVSGGAGIASAAESVAQLWSPSCFTGWSSSWCSSTPSPLPLSTTTSQTGWPKFRVGPALIRQLMKLIARATCTTNIALLLPRGCQQSSPGNVHPGDAGEDVQLGAAGLLCVPVQSLWLFCGVRRHRGDHPGGARHHVPARYLCLPLRASPADLQSHTVSNHVISPHPPISQIPLWWFELLLVRSDDLFFPSADIGRLSATWWPPCWIPWSPSPLCCCCSSSSSSSFPCWECSFSGESLILTRLWPKEALSITSPRPCWLCSRWLPDFAGAVCHLSGALLGTLLGVLLGTLLRTL